jgi:glycosidase
MAANVSTVIVYESPQVDMGYDIANYRAIHPPYGTMADVEALIQGLHDRGMRFVMDLVVNHTSDQVRHHVAAVLNVWASHR